MTTLSILANRYLMARSNQIKQRPENHPNRKAPPIQYHLPFLSVQYRHRQEPFERSQRNIISQKLQRSARWTNFSAMRWPSAKAIAPQPTCVAKPRGEVFCSQGKRKHKTPLIEHINKVRVSQAISNPLGQIRAPVNFLLLLRQRLAAWHVCKGTMLIRGQIVVIMRRAI
jgi:hypothetical protein